MEAKCSYCRHKFPAQLIEELMLADHGGTISMPSCPVCALKFRNEVACLHPDTPYGTDIAKTLFYEAVEHLGIDAPRWAYNLVHKGALT